MCTVVLIGSDPATPPPSPPRALLVSQDRRHLFLTPCLSISLSQLIHVEYGTQEERGHGEPEGVEDVGPVVEGGGEGHQAEDCPHAHQDHR